MLTTVQSQIILVFVFLLSFLLWPLCSANASLLFEDKYDFWFKKYTDMYMYGVDWRLLKAQCYAESSFQEDAVSPVGAQGLCQFMPGTWKDVERGLRIRGNPFDTKLNVQFAAYYMGRLRRNWVSNRPEVDKHNLAMASYNAGLGNILKAQVLCNMAVLYPKIIACLPAVTGAHSKETINYVKKIRDLFKKLIFW